MARTADFRSVNESSILSQGTMKFNNNPDRDEDFTVVFTMNGRISTITYGTNIPFDAFKGVNINDLGYSGRQGQWFKCPQFTHPQSQIILRKLGEADIKSLKEQIGGQYVRVKKQVQFVLNQHTKAEMICAQVLSRVYDQISGKFGNSSFTYSSNHLNFSACWDWDKRKFIIHV